MQKYLLNTVAEIDSGKSFRQKPDFISGDGCWLIQMKDFSFGGFVQTPQSISLDEVNSGQLLNSGDLIFVAKGNNNYAVIYEGDRPATAVSLFFIIRPDRSKVDPGYLVWAINSAQGQKYFERHRMGASVGNIRKKALENFELELPSLDVQQKIARLYQLTLDERRITHEYLDLKEVYLNQSISNLISG